MPSELWLRMISISVVPVVIISACGLLCLAFYNRLAAIVSRARAFQQEVRKLREQLLLQTEKKAPPTAIEVNQNTLSLLNDQTARILRRAHHVKRTLACLLLAIGLLVLCSIAVGLSVLTPVSLYIAVPFFLLGLLSLLSGIVFALIELHGSLDPVTREQNFSIREDAAANEQ